MYIWSYAFKVTETKEMKNLYSHTNKQNHKTVSVSFFHCWTSKSAWVTYWVLSTSRVNNNTLPLSTETTRGFRYSIINKIAIFIIKQTQLFINFIDNKTTLLVRMRKYYSQNWNIKKKPAEWVETLGFLFYSQNSLNINNLLCTNVDMLRVIAYTDKSIGRKQRLTMTNDKGFALSPILSKLVDLNFLDAVPFYKFNTVPYVAVTPTMKLLSFIIWNCNFVIVINSNINIHVSLWSWINPVIRSLDPKGVTNDRSKVTAI